MNIRILLLFVCAAPSVWTVAAQEKQEEKKNPVLSTPVMEERVSELMSDRVVTTTSTAIQGLMEVNENAALLNKENLMFPADELYGSDWDNRWVNPFHNKTVSLPDSFGIDCSTFVLPIDCPLKVTSNYGMRRRRMHRGIDLKVQIGDTIRASFNGKIRMRSFERYGYGYYLVVRHPNGLETVYGHLSKFLVSENDIVRAGDPIALGGNTGRSTGSHLHFETRFLGIDINPANIIDFKEGVPHQDLYVFRSVKSKGRNTNVYVGGNGQMAYHRVKSGDTLEKIARANGTTIDELCRLNGIKRTTILRIGQSIRCSSGGEVQVKEVKQAPKETTVKASLAAVSSMPETTTTKTKTKTTASAPTPKAAGQSSIAAAAGDDAQPVYHRIQQGDTLGALAKRYGTSIQKICQLNGISRTTILKLGRSIRCS